MDTVTDFEKIQQRIAEVLDPNAWYDVEYPSATMLRQRRHSMLKARAVMQALGMSDVEYGVRYPDGRVNGPTDETNAKYLSTRDGQEFPVVMRATTTWFEV